MDAEETNSPVTGNIVPRSKAKALYVLRRSVRGSKALRPKTEKKVRTMTRSEPAEPEAADEAAMAAATIMQLEEEDAATSVLTVPESDPALPLHRVAEEILSGVKRRVEVQYLVHDLNSGVIGNSYWWSREPDTTIVISVPFQSTPTPTPCLRASSVQFSEFINPVSKEDIVSESGLDTSHCEAATSLLSEFNSELHLTDNLFNDELPFPCYSQL